MEGESTSSQRDVTVSSRCVKGHVSMNGRRLCNGAEPSDQFFSGRLQSGRLVDTFTAAWLVRGST